jgi:hypothetical protein
MSRQTLNGYPLLQAIITEPQSGRWTATVEVSTETAPVDPVEISFDDGAVVLVGAIHGGGVESGRWLGRIVGGTGGLSTELTSKAYRAMPLQIVLDDIISETDETLATTATSLITRTVPHWHRQIGYGTRAMSALADAVGMVWRVLRDGTIWIGVDTFPAVSVDATWTQLHAFPDLGMVEIAPGDAPLVGPGVTWNGVSVGTVLTRLDGGVLRQEVWRAAA